MFICTDVFLKELKFKTEDERQSLVARLIKKPEILGRVRVLVLSDLHLQSDANEGFLDRLAEARKWFGWEPEEVRWDAMVVAGDLVAGNEVGWQDDHTGKKVGWQDSDGPVPFNKCHEDLERIHKAAASGIKASVALGQALVVPGNHDIVRRGGEAKRRSGMKDMLTSQHLHQASSFVKHVQSKLASNSCPLGDASQHIPRLLLMGWEHGVVGMIGLDSNQMAYSAPGMENLGYIGSEQLDRIKKLIKCLRDLFADRPLFLWTTWHHHLLPVYNTEWVEELRPKLEYRDPEAKELLSVFDAITVDGRSVVENLCELGVSLATHGHMHAHCIQRVSYSARTDRTLNVVACPACLSEPNSDHPFVGATLVEVDLERGLTEVFISGFQRLRTAVHEYKIVPFVEKFAIPVIPASRVPLGEMRLFRHLDAWLNTGTPSTGRLGVFAQNVPHPKVHADKSSWEKSFENCLSRTGYVPVCMGRPEEVIRNGLLSREDIALLPKKKYRLLLLFRPNSTGSYDILLNNFFPLRTPEYGSWDTPLLPAFKSLHGLVSGWLMDVRRQLDDFRERDMKGERVSAEIEALEHILNELTKKQEDDDGLVTVSSEQFLKFSPTDGVPTLYEYQLTVWPLLTAEPETDLCRFLTHYVKPVPPGKVAGTSFRDYGRGLVWLPFSHWQDCAAITARNVDVMEWVESTLTKLKMGATAPPRWLILGSGKKLEIEMSNYEAMPFGSGSATRQPPPEKKEGEMPTSLVMGLDWVKMSNGEHIYQGKEICKGVLRLEKRDHRIGITVSVLDNNGLERHVGYLRPVQRYVLNQGLRRAEGALNSVNLSLKDKPNIVDLGKSDGFGYLKTTLPGGRVISILPLIVEQIANADEEGNFGDSLREFVLCDGNHRLVRYLLVDGNDSVGCSVVMGEPKQPYYAWPYSRWDWNIVLQNQLEATPDLHSKYTPRYPVDSDPEDIKQNPNIYRQFFRNLNTGFNDIGDQGGRIA